MMIWIAINGQEAADKLRMLIDRGAFAEANQLSDQLSGFGEQVKSHIQRMGGSLKVNLPERQVMSIPEDAVEEMYQIMTAYKEMMGRKVAIGVGTDYAEACKACALSSKSNSIELYDPSRRMEEDEVDHPGIEQPAQEMGPNVFDPTKPEPPPPNPHKKSLAEEPEENAAVRISAQDQMAGEQQMLTAMAAASQPEQPPQQPQQAQPQQPTPEMMQALDRKAGSGKGKAEETEKSDDKIAESEKPDKAAKLVGLLANIKGHLPEIMSLHDTNPQAFEQAVNMISKLSSLTKSLELEQYATPETKPEDLQKSPRITWPVGSLLRGKKKVQVGGRAVWRSVRSGQVKDAGGSAISVKASNKEATGKEE